MSDRRRIEHAVILEAVRQKGRRSSFFCDAKGNSVKTAGYVRISTDEQAEHGVSMDEMRCQILERIEERGLAAP